MLHSEAGAVRPTAFRASVSAKYVFEGNVPNFVQFDTVDAVQPVKARTAAFPPNTSITAFVVVNSSIIRAIIQFA